MTRHALVFLFASILVPLATAQQEAPEEIMEIIVRGRQPGPPLWKVTNDDNTLWIFGYLPLIPEDMVWKSDKVAQVIADSQEYLSLPEVRASLPPLLLANPFNLIRGVRLASRLSRMPDEAPLRETLPPDLYERFAVLKARYFERNKGIEELRPIAASERMAAIIVQKNGLVDGGEVIERIERLVRRNRDIETTETRIKVHVDGNFRDIADRFETLMASLPLELEISCMESVITRMETDLDKLKDRADSWALGHVDQFRDIPLPRAPASACARMMMASSESVTREEMEAQSDQAWLQSAERALHANRSTFAVLGINELIAADGLLEQLRARGYEIREP